MKEKTKEIGNWHELVEFVTNTNPNKKTLILSGYVNELYDGKTYVKRLYFSTINVNVLKKKVKKNEHTKLVKKHIKKNTRK